MCLAFYLVLSIYLLRCLVTLCGFTPFGGVLLCFEWPSAWAVAFEDPTSVADRMHVTSPTQLGEQAPSSPKVVKPASQVWIFVSPFSSSLKSSCHGLYSIITWNNYPKIETTQGFRWHKPANSRVGIQIGWWRGHSIARLWQHDSCCRGEVSVGLPASNFPLGIGQVNSYSVVLLFFLFLLSTRRCVLWYCVYALLIPSHARSTISCFGLPLQTSSRDWSQPISIVCLDFEREKGHYSV